MTSCLRKSFLLVVFSLLATLSYAGESVPGSVRDLIILGLEKNIGLQVEQLNIPVAAQAIVSDAAVFDSELFAAAGYSKAATPVASSLSLLDRSESELLNGEIGARKKYQSGLLASIALSSAWTEDNSQTDDLDPRYRSALTLVLAQPLLRDFGSAVNTTNLRITRNQLSQTELQYHLQAQSLALQVEVLAGQLAGETEIVILRSEAVALARELYAANKRRFDAGVIPVSEVQEAETALANRELNLSLAHQSRDLSFEILNRQLNHSLEADFASDSLFSFVVELVDFPVFDFEQLFANARNKNLSLQLAAYDIKNAALQQNFYQNQLQPRLDLNLLAGLNGLSGDERSASITSRYAGSWQDSFSSAAKSDGFQWGVGLEFSVPLGNRAAKAKVRQADLLRKQTGYRLRNLETELRSNLQQQLINLQRAHEQVEIAKRFEHLAGLSLQQEQRRLDEGLSDTFRIISFQDNMVNAKIGRINALVLYYSSFAQLNFTRGNILDRHNISLQQITEENSLETM